MARHLHYSLDDVLAMTPRQLQLLRDELGEQLREEAGAPDEEKQAKIRAAQASDIEHRIKRAKAKGKRTMGLDKLIGESYGRH